tara:strand:- start:98 stop:1114 length:1017 start_codon:yes stop_codon:yes gene_type:complete
VEFDESISSFDIDASGIADAQTSPSGFSSDLGTGDSAEDFNSFISSFGLNPQQTYTMARGAKSKALGDNVNNPYPESFFSKLFGAENVDYTNILGSSGTDRINDLRFRQATGQSSLITGQPYQAGDFYIGQPTEMGVVKPIPSTASNILNFLPGGGILNAIIPQKGLPEKSKEYQDLMAEEAKSANDPTVFDRTSDFVKEKTGFGPKDSGASLAASPTRDGQMRVPDNRVFDEFGNELQGIAKFQATRPEPKGFYTEISPVTGRIQLKEKPKVEKVADNFRPSFNILQGIGRKFNPEINEFLRQNVSPNLEFESDVRPDFNDPNSLMPYMGLTYRFTA